MPVCLVGCALSVDYAGYERESGSGGHDAGTGASSGVSGGGFGGGTAGGSGGVAGSGTGGVAGAGGITSGGGSAGSGGGSECVTSQPCATAICSNSIYLTYPCESGVCGIQQQECAPFACTSIGCNTACALASDCVPQAKCNLGQCSECITCGEKYSDAGLPQPFCLTDSESRWNQLVQCCQANCVATCIDLIGTGYAVCGGKSTAAVSVSCKTCLNDNACGNDIQYCLNDLVD